MKRYIKTAEDFVVDSPKDLDEAYMNYKAVRISKHMPKAQQAELKKKKAEYKKQMDDLRYKYQNRTIESSSDAADNIDIMPWLNIAEREIREHLKSFCTDTTYYEVDDIKWGKDCFEIPIFKGSFKGNTARPGQTQEIDAFRFYYDPDDVFERDIEGQVVDKLEEFLDEFDFNIQFNA